MGEQLERDTTVLFARVLGGADVTSLQACMQHLRKAAEDSGARVLDSGSDRLMVLLPNPDAAADTAAAMHSSMDRFPGYRGVKLGLSIGFHHGPAIQKGDQVFGDTVNLAAQLVAKAANGQIITTRESGSHFSPLYRAWMRKLGSIDIKGRSGQVEICELIWRGDDNATIFAKRRVEAPPDNISLRLSYRGKLHVRRRERDAITIGRDETSGIPIRDNQASRLHCTIERRQDKFVLTDHSTNGTYVKINGGDEVLVQREEFALTGKGTIACGQPAVSTKEIVQFELGIET
jgi:class 3 adenylate cyclase